MARPGRTSVKVGLWVLLVWAALASSTSVTLPRSSCRANMAFILKGSHVVPRKVSGTSMDFNAIGETLSTIRENADSALKIYETKEEGGNLANNTGGLADLLTDDSFRILRGRVFKKVKVSKATFRAKCFNTFMSQKGVGGGVRIEAYSDLFEAIQVIEDYELDMLVIDAKVSDYAVLGQGNSPVAYFEKTSQWTDLKDKGPIAIKKDLEIQPLGATEVNTLCVANIPPLKNPATFESASGKLARGINALKRAREFAIRLASIFQSIPAGSPIKTGLTLVAQTPPILKRVSSLIARVAGSGFWTVLTHSDFAVFGELAKRIPEMISGMMIRGRKLPIWLGKTGRQAVIDKLGISGKNKGVLGPRANLEVYNRNGQSLSGDLWVMNGDQGSIISVYQIVPLSTNRKIRDQYLTITEKRRFTSQSPGIAGCDLHNRGMHCESYTQPLPYSPGCASAVLGLNGPGDLYKWCKAGNPETVAQPPSVLPFRTCEQGSTDLILIGARRDDNIAITKACFGSLSNVSLPSEVKDGDGFLIKDAVDCQITYGPDVIWPGQGEDDHLSAQVQTLPRSRPDFPVLDNGSDNDSITLGGLVSSDYFVYTLWGILGVILTLAIVYCCCCVGVRNGRIVCCISPCRTNDGGSRAWRGAAASSRPKREGPTIPGPQSLPKGRGIEDTGPSGNPGMEPAGREQERRLISFLAFRDWQWRNWFNRFNRAPKRGEVGMEIHGEREQLPLEQIEATLN